MSELYQQRPAACLASHSRLVLGCEAVYLAGPFPSDYLRGIVLEITNDHARIKYSWAEKEVEETVPLHLLYVPEVKR